MTYETMNSIIQAFCRHRTFEEEGGCECCPIQHLCEPISGTFTTHEEECYAAYKVLVKLNLAQAEGAEKAPDNVNHPAHYETGKYECIDVMCEALGVDTVKGFCLGNAFKYLYRCKRKHQSPTEDVKKAIWYLNKFVELEG